MPIPPSIPAAPSRPFQPPPFSLQKTLNSIRLDSIHNSPPPTFTYCHMSAEGVWNRQASGHALSVCYDIFAKPRPASSRRESDAISKTLQWMAPNSEDRLGAPALLRFFVSGATYASLLELLKTSPDDPVLQKCRDELEATIYRAGVRAGRCPTAPVGACTGGKTVKFTKVLREAQKRVEQCNARIGSQRLMDGMARALLTRPIAGSIEERRPRLAPILNSPEAKDVQVYSLIKENLADETERRIAMCLEIGTWSYVDSAIFALMGIPEYLKWGLPLPIADGAEVAPGTS